MKSTLMWSCWLLLIFLWSTAAQSTVVTSATNGSGAHAIAAGAARADAAAEFEAGLTLAPDESAQDKVNVNVSCLLGPVVKLSQHPVIVEQVRLYNLSPHRPSPHLDELWPLLTPDSPPLKKVLDNPSTEILMQFISLVSLRGEGMLMGADGGLVAATNHTTDFWQGDEAQFRSVMDGEGKQPIVLAAYHDISTQHFLIKIAAPVLDSEQRKVGVLVIGFDALVMEFRQLC